MTQSQLGTRDNRYVLFYGVLRHNKIVALFALLLNIVWKIHFESSGANIFLLLSCHRSRNKHGRLQDVKKHFRELCPRHSTWDTGIPPSQVSFGLSLGMGVILLNVSSGMWVILLRVSSGMWVILLHVSFGMGVILLRVSSGMWVILLHVSSGMWAILYMCPLGCGLSSYVCPLGCELPSYVFPLECGLSSYVCLPGVGLFFTCVLRNVGYPSRDGMSSGVWVILLEPLAGCPFMVSLK